MGVKGNETVTEGDDDNHYEFELRTSPPSDRHKFPNNKNGERVLVEQIQFSILVIIMQQSSSD